MTQRRCPCSRETSYSIEYHRIWTKMLLLAVKVLSMTLATHHADHNDVNLTKISILALVTTFNKFPLIY